MARGFIATTFTPEVLAAQEKYYGRARAPSGHSSRDELGAAEAEFIASRDSFYMATVSSNGWPYLQHRGGPPGFLKVVGEGLLAFADFQGNRQLISTGNLAKEARVALFLMDYPQRRRLKILGYATVLDLREHSELAESVATDYRAKVERMFAIQVQSFDWNCPQHITPRFTEGDVEKYVAPLRERLAQLEALLAAK